MVGSSVDNEGGVRFLYTTEPPHTALQTYSPIDSAASDGVAPPPPFRPRLVRPRLLVIDVRPAGSSLICWLSTATMRFVKTLGGPRLCCSALCSAISTNR